MLYSDIKQKDVINICDGRRLGRPCDLVLNEHACIEAIVVPSQAGIMAVFRSDREGMVIRWDSVRRIGDDVILVELETDE